MLEDTLVDAIQKIQAHRRSNPDESREILNRLNILEYDIKWLIRIMEKQKLRKIA